MHYGCVSNQWMRIVTIWMFEDERSGDWLIRVHILVSFHFGNWSLDGYHDWRSGKLLKGIKKWWGLQTFWEWWVFQWFKQATNLAPNQASFNLTAHQNQTINRYNHMASKHLLSLLLFVNFMEFVIIRTWSIGIPRLI